MSSSCLEGLFIIFPSTSSTIWADQLLIDKRHPASSHRAKPNFLCGGAGPLSATPFFLPALQLCVCVQGSSSAPRCVNKPSACNATLSITPAAALCLLWGSCGGMQQSHDLVQSVGCQLEHPSARCFSLDKKAGKLVFLMSHCIWVLLPFTEESKLANCVCEGWATDGVRRLFFTPSGYE